jgi:hypothetical protein
MRVKDLIIESRRGQRICNAFKPRELDYQLRFEIEEMTLQMQ